MVEGMFSLQFTFGRIKMFLNVLQVPTAGIISKQELFASLVSVHLQQQCVIPIDVRPGMWRLRDKIGMSLEEIHISGTVPQCEYPASSLLPTFQRVC